MDSAGAVENAAVGRRLKLCLGILITRQRLEKVAPARAIDARQLAKTRIGAMRRQLLGRAPSLADELLSPDAGFKRLAGILEAAKGADEHEKRAARAYGEEIYRLLRNVADAERTNGLTDHVAASRDVFGLLGDLSDNGDADPLVDAHIERGKFGEGLREEIAHAAALPDASNLRIEEVSPELAKERAEVDAEIAASYDVYAQSRVVWRGALARFNDGVEAHVGDEELARLASEKDAAEEQNAKDCQAYVDFKGAKYDEYLAKVKTAMDKARAELEAPKVAIGQKAIAAVMDSSPISEDAAKAWADAVEITPAAANRLKKAGYPVDKVRADIAEFYRFTGGCIGTVRIDSKGDRRANATDITTAGAAGTVWLDGNFDKRVLWHELGHHIEADPLARTAASRFIRRRSVNGDSVVRLRNLTGNKGYKSDEVAYENGSFHPYVGKRYSGGITEVFSMGIESFSDPLMLGRRMAQDPQTLEFVSGYLKAEQSPLYRAFMELREKAREINAGAKEEKRGTIRELQEKLAGMVTLIDDTDESWLGNKRYYGMDGWVQIGRFDNGYYLFSGKVRNVKTKRQVKGLILLRDTGGWPDVVRLATSDTTIAKAAAAIWGKTGKEPYMYKLEDENFLQETIAA